MKLKSENNHEFNVDQMDEKDELMYFKVDNLRINGNS